MTRTATEIANETKTNFIQNNVLRNLYGLNDGWQNFQGSALEFYNSKFSPVTIESLLIYIVSAAIAQLENFFDFFKSDVQNIVDNERYGYAGWYVKKSLEFQFGYNLNDNGTYDDISEDAEVRVVHYVHAEENNNGIGVLLKVAGETQGSFTPITKPQLEAFKNYINRIKPAGVLVSVRNEAGDNLYLKLTIYYNPLVLTQTGQRISDGTFPVKDAIKNYLNSIKFNGEFIKMKLVDEIQKVEGVEIVENTYASYIDGLGASNEILIKHTPFAGYMEWDDTTNLQITYLPRI